MLSGLIVLIGYFVSLPGLMDFRAALMDWAVILAAVAVIVGVINLSRVHWNKLRSGQNGAAYSGVTLVFLALTTIVVLYFQPDHAWSVWVFNYLLAPIEGSLMAILAVTLIIAIGRMFSRQMNFFRLIFVITVLVFLAFSVLLTLIPGLAILREEVYDVFPVAGARGILLGIALGAIATGLRVLMGADRSYNR